jgi:prolycopene isomerase
MTYSRGAWLIEGGVERLSQALVKAIVERGGLVVRKSKAVSIVTAKGGVLGVRSKDGYFYRSSTVVVATAVRPALEDWLDDPQVLPHRFRQRISRMEATGSYYIAYYSVPSGAIDGLWPNIEVRESNGILWGTHTAKAWYMLVPSIIDSTSAPPGFHCLCLSIPCPPELTFGPAARNQCRKYVEQAAEARFPQLRSRLSFIFDLGPEQLAAISGNPGGSAYGWALTPEQSGVKRLNLKTPLRGLYLAGHWTMPGGGIAGVVTSGRLCAQAILQRFKA